MQEAALKLGVLTSEEFDTLVVPEKMIGPTDRLIVSQDKPLCFIFAFPLSLSPDEIRIQV